MIRLQRFFEVSSATTTLVVACGLLAGAPRLAFAQLNAPARPSTRAAVSGTVTVTGTQTIAEAGDCSDVKVTIAGELNGTVDDGGGVDQVSFQLWDDGTLKDSATVDIPVGSTQPFSVTLSFLGLYLTGAAGVGVLVVDDPSAGILFDQDPFFPTDVAGVCPICGASPRPVCDTAEHSQFQYKDKDPAGQPDKRRLKFSFNKGSAGDASLFGDPSVDAEYTLCIYENNAFEAAVDVPAGSSWKANGKGFKYSNVSATDIQKIKLKAGTVAKPAATKAQVKGKGTGLPALTLPLTEPVTVQLVNDSNTSCFGATFPTANKNDAAQYKAKQ